MPFNIIHKKIFSEKSKFVSRHDQNVKYSLKKIKRRKILKIMHFISIQNAHVLCNVFECNKKCTGGRRPRI